VTPLCSLRRALSDPKLLGSVLAGDSWQAWRVVLIAAMGEALTDDERVIFKRLTGRECEPGERVDELAAVVGRRGGKSRALATFATYIAALCEHRLVPGERGLVLIVAQNQRAARVVLHYAAACFDAAPALAALVVSRSGDSIQLNTGVQLEVATRDFNPTVPAAWIEHELERDPARNSSEYLAVFRTDVEGFVALEVVEAAVGDFSELLPVATLCYHAFVDPAGGSGSDSFTLAVAHRDSGGNAVIDAVRERRPPFSPAAVVDDFCRLLESYRVSSVHGDRYAGGFASEAFNRHGIRYQPATRTKSDAFVDLLSLLNSGGVVLPRNERLVAQLVGLERRTSRGTGRDIVDHSPGGHDDLANAVAGAALLARAPGYDTSLAWIDGTPIGDPSSYDPRRSMRSR
jgi:hypothetical protein